MAHSPHHWHGYCVHTQAGSLARHVASLPPSISGVYVDCSSFGTSGVKARNAHTEIATLLETHTQRAPYRKFMEGRALYAFRALSLYF